VLFSEPKIPQYGTALRRRPRRVGFSALQRAENSSIRSRSNRQRTPRRSFSALQRAENSSMSRPRLPVSGVAVFQCSSASRKFLNLVGLCAHRL